MKQMKPTLVDVWIFFSLFLDVIIFMDSAEPFRAKPMKRNAFQFGMRPQHKIGRSIIKIDKTNKFNNNRKVW